MPESNQRKGFRVDIEGLRGVAVLLVVVYHAGWALPGGYVGVDVFFVLSGYLITGILADEVARRHAIDFGRFFARRIRRLLPAAFATIALTSAAAFFVFSPLEHRTLILSAASSAAYVGNVYFARNALDYLGTEGDRNPFLHLWSLSVEEQFYVVWPFVIAALALLGRRTRLGVIPALQIGLTATVLLSLAISVAMTEWRQPWAFFLPFARAWEFAIGGLVAVLPVLALTSRWRSWLTSAAGWLGLALVLIAAVIFDASTPFPGFHALIPVLGTALVVWAGTNPIDTRGSVGTTVLALRPLRYLGSRSYAWYLWHWPALVLLRATYPDASPTMVLGAVVGSLLLADASTRWIEDPFRHRVRFVASTRGALAFGLGITVLGIAVAGSWWVGHRWLVATPAFAELSSAQLERSPVHENGCHVDQWAVAPADCTMGSDDPDAPTVVLFGDSHAAQWSTALLLLAERHDWRLIPLTKSACPAAAVMDFAHPQLRRAYTECDDWREAVFDRIDQLEPDLIVTTSRFGGDVDPGAWSAAVGRTVARLAPSGATIVHVLDPYAPGFEVPMCVASQRWFALAGRSSCTFERDDAHAQVLDAERTVLQAYPRVAIADAAGVVCAQDPCPVEFDVDGASRLMWSDSNHLTNTYVAARADLFEAYFVVR